MTRTSWFPVRDQRNARELIADELYRLALSDASLPPLTRREARRFADTVLRVLREEVDS